MKQRTRSALRELRDTLASAGVNLDEQPTVEEEKTQPAEAVDEQPTTEPTNEVQPTTEPDATEQQLADITARLDAVDGAIADITARLEALEKTTSETSDETTAMATALGHLARAVRSTDYRATAPLRAPVATAQHTADVRASWQAMPWTHEKVQQLIDNPKLAE